MTTELRAWLEGNRANADQLAADLAAGEQDAQRLTTEADLWLRGDQRADGGELLDALDAWRTRHLDATEEGQWSAADLH